MTITQEAPSTEGSRPVTSAELAHPPHGPLALLNLLQCYVEETSHSLSPPPIGLADRSYELLELTDDLEIWAIHWPQGRGLELHDHGGSAGALWVVRGSLEEHYVRPERTLGRRSLVVGGGAAFGPDYVHDVVNTDRAPATSIHVYSPPMGAMTFYRHEQTGLRAERTEFRDDPTWAP